jgi:eukaryotic-like serine/threonine-protein kinase
VVYRAEDLDRRRPAALKLLHPGALEGDRGRDRLAREAHACVALQHPNITEVFEVGEADGVCFVAMELLEGETVRQLADRGPIGWREAVRIGCQVASALARAHRQGLVHRDIKPENIMVGPDGRVKLLDFGLSRTLGPETGEGEGGRVTRAERITRAGSVLGTIDYMSPEQAQGRDAGPASDTFSVGVVLYEMLAGRLPFHGDNLPQRIHAIVFDEPEPLRTYRVDVPSAVERLLRRALQKRIDRRYADGAALEADLRALERDPGSGEELPGAGRSAAGMAGRMVASRACCRSSRDTASAAERWSCRGSAASGRGCARTTRSWRRSSATGSRRGPAASRRWPSGSSGSSPGCRGWAACWRASCRSPPPAWTRR